MYQHAVCFWALWAFLFLGSSYSASAIAEPGDPISAAVLPFQWRKDANVKSDELANDRLLGDNRVVDRDPGVPKRDAVGALEKKKNPQQEIAANIVDLLTVKLLTSEHVYLVERQDIEKALDELKLSRAGLVKADEAVQVGKLTGAKLLITGSVFQIDNDLYVVAKIIGTETSRLAGASVKGPANGNPAKLVDRLAVELEEVLSKKGESLLPKVQPEEDWIAAIKKKISNKLPTVTVKVQQSGDAAQPSPGSISRLIDPFNVSTDPAEFKSEVAARTEFERLCKELGFELIAADHLNARRADLAISVVAKSEFAFRRGDWVSVRSRVDVQVKSQATGEVIASESDTVMSFDIAENAAAKAGIQEATRKVAEKVIPKIAK